jgi:hypothetical protein
MSSFKKGLTMKLRKVAVRQQQRKQKAEILRKAKLAAISAKRK